MDDRHTPSAHEPVRLEQGRGAAQDGEGAGSAAIGYLVRGEEVSRGLEVLAHLHRSKDSDVYLAHSVEHGCPVVAKVLRPQRRDSEGARRRLAGECEVLPGLAHPGIVRALATDPDQPLLVMEYLPGTSVRAHLASRGDLPWVETADLGAQLAAALHYLHGRQLIHADVKPANAIVRPGGEVVLIDFSLVRPPGTYNRGLGTRQFASPEQARGEAIGPPTDVWGLGVILYRAATGRLPFTGEGTPQTSSRAPMVRTRRSLPTPLARIIDAALDPAPGSRPTATELARELAATREQIAQRLGRPLD